MTDQIEPLTADERAAIARKHRPDDWNVDLGVRCVYERLVWPCPVARLLATVDTAEAERDAARAWAALWKRACSSKRRVVRRLVNDLVRMGRAWDERDAALARVDALRAAVETVIDGLEHRSLTEGEMFDVLTAALAAGPADREQGG